MVIGDIERRAEEISRDNMPIRHATNKLLCP